MKDRDLKSLEYFKIKDLLSNKCVTYLGKEIVFSLYPSNNINDVRNMQNETSEAVSYVLRKGNIPLFSIKKLDDIFLKINIGACLSMSELLDVANILMLTRKLKKYFESSEIDISDFEILNMYFEALYSNSNVEDEIFRCIKSEEVMDDRASKTLYDIRRKITDSESKIKDKLNSIIHSSSTSKYLQDSVVTFRNDRYVIPVKQEYKNEIQGLIHDSSSSGSTLFIEPTAIFNINNEIKELKIQEQQEIERILMLLTSMISPICDEIKDSMKYIGLLDFAFAKASFSLEMDAFSPQINEGKYINLKKARHPLIPKEKVVPIDIWIGDKFKSLIITGPNTGGKTVSLKTVGLLCLMAQSGLHIPALESSEVPVFDNIFCDIGDEQSIEQSLSTFSSHMVNVIDILEKSSENSLVLLDELGSGTDPVEGAALARAILERLYSLNVLTIATTHYSELKTFALNTDGVENASSEFDVKSLRPTYKLLIGVPGKSNAFEISKKLGLSDDIIKNASNYLTAQDIKFEDVLSELEKDRRLAREQRELTDAILLDAKNQKEKVDKEVEKLNKKKDEILLKAKIEARDILLNTEEEASEIIKELVGLKKKNIENKNKIAEEARDKIKKNLSLLQKDLIVPDKKVKNKIDIKDIKIGLDVFVPSLDENGTIISLPDKKENVLVQIGILKMSMHISKLEKISQTKKEEKSKSVSNMKSKTMDISTEIMLIGMTVDEATDVLDKYIDDAYLANIHTIRIVHGKGSGALRIGVQNYLKNNSHIKSFRNGVYGEGENGVTIAELKN